MPPLSFFSLIRAWLQSRSAGGNEGAVRVKMEFLSGVANSVSISAVSDYVDEQRAQYYPKNETEKRVYEALGSQNWGASTTLMTEIANDTFQYDRYQIVMQLLWDNCLDKPDASRGAPVGSAERDLLSASRPLGLSASI